MSAKGIALSTALAMTLPAEGGCYVLHLHLSRSRTLRIGQLGRFTFASGEYIYVGSAFGLGGLRSRVGRHLHSDGRWHWHIDYLRSAADVHGCFYTVTDRPLECEWSQALAALPNATIPMPRFGSSDCRSGCRSHLIAFSTDFRLAIVQRALADVVGRTIDQVFVD